MSELEAGQGLKREIIEARNQAIKTDNQIKNLSLDVRNFEKRFDTLEGRVRWSSFGTNLLVAICLAGCAYGVTSVMGRAYEQELAQLRAAVREEQVAAEAQRGQLGERLASLQNQALRANEGGNAVLQVLDLLGKRRDAEAGAALEAVDWASLTPLERALCQTRFADLRRRQAIALFRTGRQATQARDLPAAVRALGRSLELDSEGPMARAARQQLAQALWHAKRYAEAEPVLRGWLNQEPDEASGMARYLLATSLARMGKGEAARAEFLQVLGHPHWAPAARAYLAALEARAELPEDLGNGRVRPLPAAAASSPRPAADAAPAAAGSAGTGAP